MASYRVWLLRLEEVTEFGLMVGEVTPKLPLRPSARKPVSGSTWRLLKRPGGSQEPLGEGDHPVVVVVGRFA